MIRSYQYFFETVLNILPENASLFFLFNHSVKIMMVYFNLFHLFYPHTEIKYFFRNFVISNILR